MVLGYFKFKLCICKGKEIGDLAVISLDNDLLLNN